MKAAKMTVAGVTYYLVFDGEAMFMLRDIYGGTQLALEAIEPDTREGFAATCALLLLLFQIMQLVAELNQLLHAAEEL